VKDSPDTKLSVLSSVRPVVEFDDDLLVLKIWIWKPFEGAFHVSHIYYRTHVSVKRQRPGDDARFHKSLKWKPKINLSILEIRFVRKLRSCFSAIFWIHRSNDAQYFVHVRRLLFPIHNFTPPCRFEAACLYPLLALGQGEDKSILSRFSNLSLYCL
jgi:hypothetical protein